MFPKKGNKFPNGSNGQAIELNYATAIGTALNAELRGTHRSIKTIMSWTDANERTVKNWLAGSSGPRGEHLIGILRHSDEVFRAFVRLCGREQTHIVVSLVDARAQLELTICQLDRLLSKEGTNSSD